MQIPDKWVILELPDGLYKVLAGWYGGYLGCNRWRINSGIKAVYYEDGYYIFEGFSGSLYKCFADSEGFMTETIGIYNKLKETYGNNVEYKPFEYIKDKLNEHSSPTAF